MKKFLIVLLILALIAGGVAYWAYQAIFAPNVTGTEDSTIIFIPTGSTYEDLRMILDENNLLVNSSTFDKVASYMGYTDEKVLPGKYRLKKGWSNKEVISVLRSGRQLPVKVTFNNLRTKEDLAGKISSYLEIDSLELVKHFQDAKVHKESGLDSYNFMSLFIPNTYEFFWNTRPEEVVKRLKQEHEKFWSKDNRIAKAQKLGLTKEEVYTVASIVEKESQKGSERPIIAGLYLNRINIGMPLQADPTVVFATGKFDLRRVLLKHLEFDSPYNTYKYPGLPPGPIYMPSIASIDGVLNRADHKYLYMCASPEAPGAHLFAESLTAHNANARKYHRWLNSRGIR